MAFTDSALFPGCGPTLLERADQGYVKIKVRKAIRKRFNGEYLGTNFHLEYAWQSRNMLGVAAFQLKRQVTIGFC